MEQIMVQIVPQQECDRLLERQSDARMWVRANPYAHLLNVAWKRFYKHSGRVVRIAAEKGRGHG